MPLRGQAAFGGRYDPLMTRLHAPTRVRRRNDGGLWTAVQVLLIVAMVGGLSDRRPLPLPAQVVGLVVAGAGALLIFYAYWSLGASRSSGVGPIEGAELVTHGAFRLMRHPVYAGWVLIGLGGALAAGSILLLLATAAFAVYSDLRAREEERRLAAVFSDYAAYRARVKRFIPGLY